MTKFLFDLDGTITKQETLPLIARTFGMEEIDWLTKETIAGNIPFEESFLRRVSILKDLPVDEIARLLGSVEVYSMLAGFIQEHSEACCVITGNLYCWIDLLVQKLGCFCYASEAVVENNRIRELKSVLCKESIVRQFKKDGYRTVVIGDGDNDAGAMRVADCAIAAGLTHTPAKRALSAADMVFYDEAALCRYLRKYLGT